MNNSPIVIVVKKEESIVDKIANKLTLIRNIIVTVSLINYFTKAIKKGQVKKVVAVKKEKQDKTEE